MIHLTAGLAAVSSRVGITLVHSLWQGAAAAAMLAVALRLSRAASPAVRYAISCGALAAFVVAVAATFAGAGPVAQPRPDREVPVIDVVRPSVVATVGSMPLPAGPPPLPTSAVDPMQWAGVAWLFGASAVAVWHLAGWVWLRRQVRGVGRPDLEPVLAEVAASLGIRRIVRLVETAGLTVPAVVGVIRPVILIPLGLAADLAPDQVEAILAHELAHVRRHDYLVNLLQVVVESLLFYHPAAWWMSAQIRREREHCCDDVAAGRSTPRRYVSALMALEQRRSPVNSVLVAATGGTLLDRARRLLGRGSPVRPRPARSALAAAVALACVVVPVAVEGCGKPRQAAPPPATTRAPSVMAVADADVKSSGITADDLKPDGSVNRIGPGDLLEITVDNLNGAGPPPSATVRVSDPAGSVQVPLLGGVQVAGMTETDVQQVLAKRYKDASILNSAEVSVMRVDPQSTRFTVFGTGIGKPGDYTNVNPNLRLLQALATADAHLEGQRTVLVLRKTGPSSARTIRVAVPDLLAGDPQVNVVVRPGDLIMLPQATAAAVP